MTPVPSGRVLVTGGAGFLGRHLVARLAQAGREVVVLDDLSTGSLELLPPSTRIRVITGSVLDAAALAEAARGVELVVHLAGVVGMRRVAQEGALAYTVAADGTAAVLAATGSAPAVLVSSSAVYGLTRSNPAREADPVSRDEALAYDAGTPGYACGKLELERLATQADAAGRPVLVVRPFNVVGEGQSSSYGMVLPTFLEAAAAGRPLRVHGNGSQVRSFCEVGAFTDAFLRLVDCPAAWQLAGAPVNIGSPEPTSILDLAKLVLAETRASAPVHFVPYARDYPGRTDVPARVPEVKRLASLIGPTEWPPLKEVVGKLAQGARARRPVG